MQCDSTKPAARRAALGGGRRRRSGAGQVRLRHEAVGLNFADTYFRSGLYPVPLPAGIGVEAAGVVEAVGPA